MLHEFGRENTYKSAQEDLPLVFLLVNPTSGGNAAGKLLNIGVDTMTIRDPGSECELVIHDIRTGSTGRKPGFLQLKEYLNGGRHFTETNPVRIIVAGGDGSVMWAMSEVIAHGIDISRVAFGVVPFGTGNDFARSFGWGGSTPSGDIGRNGLHGLKKLVKCWLEASVCNFDLWEVSLHVNPESGYIQQVRSKTKKILFEEDKKITTLSKPMCNYFSIGIESRIGLGFDRNRKQSAFLNKMMYGWEGLKKSFTSTPRISELVESVVANDERRMLLSMTDSGPQCKGSPVSLIFTNIDSFAGGCNLWAKSKRLAIQGVAPDAKAALKALKQSVGDGKLEILTYNSLIGLSAEQLAGGFAGNGRRVGQENGPIRVQFRPDLGSKRCYAQIDGEFYALHEPTHADIKHIHTVKVLTCIT